MAGRGVDSVIHVPCQSEEAFYRAWVEMLTPWHRLAPREKDVAAAVLLRLSRLRETVADPDVLWDVLWSLQSKRSMERQLGMTPDHFQLVVREMRKAGFLVEGDRVNPRYIPAVGKGASRYMLLFVYDWPGKPGAEGDAEEEA